VEKDFVKQNFARINKLLPYKKIKRLPSQEGSL